MTEDRRFPPEKLAKLDSPERHARQPAAPLVALVAGWQPRAILDLGVGTGYYSLPLAEALPEARILGLDVEPRMLAELEDRRAAVAHGARVEPLEAPADHIPLPDDSVDVVLMINLYHELDDRPAHLREVRRVLGPGGRLVICDWDPESTQEAGPPRDHRIPRATTREELAAAGFGEITDHALYEPLYTLAAAAG